MAEKRKYKDLGWANGWDEKPEEVKKCQEKDHQVKTKDVGPFRGIENVVECDICEYVYRYDSSD